MHDTCETCRFETSDTYVSLLYLHFYQNIAYGNKIRTMDSKYKNNNTAFKTLHMKIKYQTIFKLGQGHIL
jgi:hypothetical protein